jgi:hypothetical protein
VQQEKDQDEGIKVENNNNNNNNKTLVEDVVGAMAR